MATTPRLSQKITAIAESATLKVDSKAKALKAQGAPVISYAAGEPDFATPEHIVEAAISAASDPANHRYTPGKGLPDLREAVAEKARRDSKIDVSADQVIITNGGKQSVYESFQVLLNPGDEVIVPTPYWTTYPEVIGLADGVAVDVFAGADQGYKVTVDQLEAARTERTKVLLFVSPSNPTGAVYSPDETRAIGEWALEHGIWVITDEIYQNLTYDGVEATSIVGAVPELANQALLVNGVAKSYAMTGWRVGWTIGPKDAVTAMTNQQSHLSGNVNNIAQRAAIAALTGSQEPVEQMRHAFDRRRHTIVEQLNLVNGFSVPTPQGAFYVYADVSGVIGREIDGVTPSSSLEVADLMLDKAQVAAVPGEAFGPSGYLRFSYALGDDALREGAERLQKLFA
ncbi:pyridoxal phosphate-dependent aminotransferase [Paramicrobacterium fandaimingii]|uniref:pyridoxal phosphate-dependent aminotransferase n=1 Tax=Paramicrobacterium fandaimingii TaxID=2708079 RepID=UPI00142377E4|nr:pyridoxal phosphate-dependent aminotransferase [Microbacterium fandaimingii]